MSANSKPVLIRGMHTPAGSRPFGRNTLQFSVKPRMRVVCANALR
jgi:hypothetical protein